MLSSSVQPHYLIEYVSLIRVAPLAQLFSHFRYLLTLRSTEGNYRSLILFRLSTSQDIPKCGQGYGEESQLEKESDPSARLNTNGKQLYAMEATCPHLGAELSHAEIEDCGDSVVAVCPWHRCVQPLRRFVFLDDVLIVLRYDFDLRTGKSETGLKACTFAVFVNMDDRDVEMVLLEAPNEGSGWRLVELRPVSEGELLLVRFIWARALAGISCVMI